jgi:hypothetical protein
MTFSTFLNWWARIGSVAAIHTAISFFGLQNSFALFTLIEKLTGIRWHGFFFLMSAFWTGYPGLQGYFFFHF